MGERLEVHSISATDDHNSIEFDGYAVYDSLADLFRYISLQRQLCVRWVSNHEYEYPDEDDDEDGLS